MKTLLILILSFMFLLSFIPGCRKEEPPFACGVENPHENLPWLKEILDKSYCVEVYLLIYKGEEIIGLYDCVPGGGDNAGFGVVWNRCDGTIFCSYSGLTGDCDCPEDFGEATKNKTLIYYVDKPLPKPKK